MVDRAVLVRRRVVAVVVLLLAVAGIVAAVVALLGRLGHPRTEAAECSSATEVLGPSLAQAGLRLGAPTGAVAGASSVGCAPEADYTSSGQWFRYDGDLAAVRDWYVERAAQQGWTAGDGCATTVVRGSTAYLTVVIPSEIGAAAEQGDYSVVVAASATSEVPVSLACG